MNGGSRKTSYLNRFASADTIVPDPTNPQSFNRYSYVHNNPIRFNDPSGHFSEDAIWNYIHEHECASDPNCTEQTYGMWQANTEWWEMLRAAQAGDVFVYGKYNPRAFGLKTKVSYQRYATFTGDGDDVLTGLWRSDVYGNIHSNSTELSFDTFFREEYRSVVNGQYVQTNENNKPFWVGFIRWDNKRPSFGVRAGMEFTHEQLHPAAAAAQHIIWFGTGYMYGGSLLSATGFEIFNVPLMVQSATGTLPTDVTVNMGPLDIAFRRFETNYEIQWGVVSHAGCLCQSYAPKWR